MSTQPSRGQFFSTAESSDTLCYARLIGLADASDIEDACRTYRYASQAFLAPPWQEIYATDEERKQDFAEAVRTHENMEEVYAEYGYETVILPKTDPAARAEFVLQTINHAGRNL